MRYPILSVFIGLALGVPVSAQARPRPNVVIILGDYMGYGDLGPYGVPDIRTPHLDRMAREGVRLTDGYAAAPICTPARAALLTGRYPARSGMESNASPSNDSYGLATSEPTLSSLLKGAGYATAAYGKWHLGHGSRFGPNAHGFDHFLGFHDWTIDYYSHRRYTGEPGLFENESPVEREGYITELLTDRAVAFIERHRHHPFFLYLAYNAALPPCQPPGRPDDIRTQETWDASTREQYALVVEALDAGVGRILAALDRNGVAENTIVVFSYDHGGRELARKEPLFHGFATLWEGGIRVPYLLRWPGRLPAGATSHQIVMSMDITTSILAAAGIALPAERPLDGIDVFPILAGQAPPAERPLFWRIDFPGRRQKAARLGRWKYMRDGGTRMLFDLETDVGERKDLIYRHPEIVARLEKALKDWEAGLPAPTVPSR